MAVETCNQFKGWDEVGMPITICGCPWWRDCDGTKEYCKELEIRNQ